MGSQLKLLIINQMSLERGSINVKFVEPMHLVELSKMEKYYNDRGEITYDQRWGIHICTLDGESVRVSSESPTEMGSWYYKCRECGAGKWSGL
jgi:hypothetical protein